MAIVLVFSGVWLVTISKARPQGPATVDGIDN
jgi:hypothetical protein